MICFLGKYFKLIRLWYWRKTGKWMWGIISAITMGTKFYEENINAYKSGKEEREFNEYLEKIFEK